MTDVKTILGVPVAQVKSVSNIPITDVKTILGSNVNQSPELPENYLTEEDSENYLTEEDTANVLTEE
jgi:hypothetical protein